jgi:transcriptional regulator with XRE-family HTH domain
VFTAVTSSLGVTSSPRFRPGVAPRGIGEGTGEERVLVDVEEARTIGARARMIREARGKPLRVVAELAGMNRMKLSRIERGVYPLDSLSEIVALANALQIAPSELVRLPIPAPANGGTDAAINAVRTAVTAVSRDRPSGLVMPVEVLRERVTAVLDAHYDLASSQVGAALPGLIRDLHTSIAAGRDVAQLLDLAVLLHAGVTVGWLRVAGAPLDLRSEASLLALRAAQNRDTPTALGLATWGGVYVMATGGQFELAQAELDAVMNVPTNTPESMQLAGTLALCQTYLASAASRPGDMNAPLEMATELAARTEESVNAYWLGFGKHAVAQWHMAAAREIGDHELIVRTAEDLRPDVYDRSREADYWVDYGVGLARSRRRSSDDAVLAFRKAEEISPHHVHRNPLVREVLAGLLTRSDRESPAGRVLRRMAYRAGLPQ